MTGREATNDMRVRPGSSVLFAAALALGAASTVARAAAHEPVTAIVGATVIHPELAGAATVAQIGRAHV